MISTQINQLIESLGCWYEDGSQALDTKREVEYAAKVGYIIPQELCNKSIHNFIETKQVNYNSTFYKKWNDVMSKNRLELFLDQLIHYASTYGTEYEGQAYIPNENPLFIPYNEYKVIRLVTIDEIVEKVLVLVNRGIALDVTLGETCAQFLSECIEKGHEIDINSILNKEVRCNVYIKARISPKSSDEIRRCIQYIIFDNSIIIQGRKELNVIRGYRLGDNDLNKILTLLSGIDENAHKRLSSEFLRFRRWWLAVKYACRDSAEIKNFINNLREMARKNHKPMREGFWESLTRHSKEYIAENINKEIQSLDNPFKIVRLIEMLKLRRLQGESNSARVFKIRNGKTWMKEGEVRYPEYYDSITKILINQLLVIIGRLRERMYKNGELPQNNPTIRFPEGLHLAVPSSGKTFVGNIPFGSYYEMKKKDNIIGIYWRNEWGTRDFDLSIIDENGRKIGWDADYYDEKGEKSNVVFSGDMTNADPEATELLYIRKGSCPRATIQVNRYNGEPMSKYKLFFAQEKIVNVHNNYMVDPNNIRLSVDIISDARQQIVGLVEEEKCYLMRFSERDSVSSYNIEGKVDSWSDMCKAHIPLKEALLGAGYREWDPEHPEITPDIDLSNPTKDELLKLL